jgi:hypothetical protein
MNVLYDHDVNLFLCFYVQYILIYKKNCYEMKQHKWHTVPVPDMSTALVMMKVTSLLQRVN